MKKASLKTWFRNEGYNCCSDHPKGKIDRKNFRKMLTEAFLHSKNPVEDVEKVLKHMIKPV